MAQDHSWVHKSKAYFQLCRLHQHEPEVHAVLSGEEEENLTPLRDFSLSEGDYLKVKNHWTARRKETSNVHSLWASHLRYSGGKWISGRSYCSTMHRRSDGNNRRSSGCKKHEEDRSYH